jgi:glucose-1-phosphate thymidylyltransferase
MNIIIPMAGMGKRLRPHTLTTPKPLLHLAGKPIVEHLVEEIIAQVDGKVDTIGFIIGDFGKEVENELIAIAEKEGSKGAIFYQKEALGTAHAILCAEELLEGPVVVAFADTLFRADFKLDPDVDGVLWVEQVADPSAFGVVELDKEGYIASFVEKPSTFVSDKAMIGIYYFKRAEELRSEMQYLIDHSIMNDGEYQLPDALRALVKKGTKFIPGTVIEWLDCGNYKATVKTNTQWLAYKKDKNLIDPDVQLNNALIIPPCYIGKGVEISNSVIGPYVSLDGNNKITGSFIRESIIGSNTQISNSHLKDSMIGNFVQIHAELKELSLGDYNQIEE